MEDLKQQYLDELKRLSNLEYRDEIKIAELTENFNGMSIEIRKKEKLLQEEQWAYLSTHPSKRLHSFCYDDDDEDYTSAITDYTIAITPKEPDNSLNISKKIYSNPQFDEEIISMKIDPHHFNVESDLIESLLNQDSSIISSSLKIDSLLDEFAGELTLLKSILPGIDKANRDPEEEIHLIEKLLYDNSSPHPPEEFISKNSDAIIESFSPSPIPVEDSDPFMEEIDLFLASDGSIPSGIDNDYSDSEGDNLFLERLLQDDPIPLPDTLDFSMSFEFFFPSSPIR
nr:hypothetical protein [Tanacetum cinerariifolium]